MLKPADLVPATAHALGEIIARSGLPTGVFNLVMGRGSVVGETLLSSKDVDAISFTGSVATGRKIAEACVAANPMKKMQLEMGGKNPMVVLDDADLKIAVETSANGAFFSTGQRCTASSRIIVTEKIHDAFVGAMVERMKGLVVDDALKAGTHIGPVVDQSQLDQDLSYIEIGRKEGATLAFGGEILNRDNPGFYLSPALFTEVDNSMRIAREEIFGPVAAVVRVKDYDEALAAANDTEFGLSAGICTAEPETCDPFQAQCRGRHGDGQPADGGCRLSRAVRRAEGLELRAARAGALCRRVLHHGEDELHAGVRPALRDRRHPLLLRWRRA